MTTMPSGGAVRMPPVATSEQLELARQTLRDRPPSFAYVALSGVCVDEYQRDLRRAWVMAIVNDYNAHLMQPLDLSLREDGSYFCIDGQHRLAAMKALGHSVIPAMVHIGLSPGDEAILFWLFQKNRHPLGSWDEFTARLTGAEPIAVGIASTVAALGLTMARSSAGDIQAVSMLEHVWHAGGGSLLHRTLSLIKDTWPLARRRFEAHLIGGVAIVLLRYGDHETFDHQRLTEVLSTIPPSAIIAAARDQAATPRQASERLDYATAHVIRDRYNRRLSSARRLPPLTSAIGRKLPGKGK